MRPIYKGKKQEKNTHHKGVSPFDYDNFNITFYLENPGPCPICGEQLQEKDLTRCELICRNPECHENEDPFHGGLVIRGTQYNIDYPESGGNRMGFTARDIFDSERLKQLGRDVSTQEVAWDKYWTNR